MQWGSIASSEPGAKAEGSPCLTFLLKINRVGHEQYTFVQYPVADRKVLIHGSPDILILNVIRLKSKNEVSS